MSNLAQVYDKIRAADAAGDTQAVAELSKLATFLSDPKQGNFQAPHNPAADMPAMDPTDTMSTTDKVLAGIGGGLTNAVRGVGQTMGFVSRDDIAGDRKLDAPLDATLPGKIGSLVGGAIPMTAALAIPGANTALGASLIGGGMGLLQPSTSTGETLANIGGGAAGNLLGLGAGRLAGALVGGAGDAAAQNATRNATVAASRDAGYVIPPSAVKPWSIPGLLEGVGGKLKTAEAASVKNQSVTNDLVRGDLGMTPGSPITSDALEAIRGQQSQAYAPVRNFGNMPTDQIYAGQVGNLGNGTLQQTFPELANPEINKLVSALQKPDVDSSGAVDALRKFRFDGFKNVASQDPKAIDLGKAQLGAADALESLLDRNLTAGGQSDAVSGMQDARRTIAKSFTAENALNDATGNVDATVLARMLDKGKPMSGGMQTAGEFGQAFKNAAKETGGGPAYSPLDVVSALSGLGGAGLGAAGHSTLGMAAGLGNTALTLARPGIRAGVLSSPVQNYLFGQAQPTNALLRYLIQDAPTVADAVADRANPLARALLQSAPMQFANPLLRLTTNPSQ